MRLPSILAVLALTAAATPSYACPAVLYGDGVHDDTVAFTALMRGDKEVTWPDGSPIWRRLTARPKNALHNGDYAGWYEFVIGDHRILQRETAWPWPTSLWPGNPETPLSAEIMDTTVVGSGLKGDGSKDHPWEPIGPYTVYGGVIRISGVVNLPCEKPVS